MDAERQGDAVVLRLSYAEMVTLHETLAYSEWAGTRAALELRDPVEEDVLSRVQITRHPLVTELGTPAYNEAVNAAWKALRSPK